MFIISENPHVSRPYNLKSFKDKIRMECVLQTADVFNRNRRKYSKDVINEGVSKIRPRITEGSLLGELDHPVDSNPVRQVTVLYKEASHKFCEVGWNGNKLVAVLETLRTPNGTILKNLAEDGVPIGFSFRGMGDLREIMKEGKTFFEVRGPLQAVTWDAVSYPSHEGANLIKITEQVSKSLQESCGFVLYEDDAKASYKKLEKILTEGAQFNNNSVSTNKFTSDLNTYDFLVESYLGKLKRSL